MIDKAIELRRPPKLYEDVAPSRKKEVAKPKSHPADPPVLLLQQFVISTVSYYVHSINLSASIHSTHLVRYFYYS